MPFYGNLEKEVRGIKETIILYQRIIAYDDCEGKENVKTCIYNGIS